MSEIVELSKEEPVVSHRVIADAIGIDAISIRKLIDNYKKDFEEFGVVSFEMTADSETKLNNPDAKLQKIYYLNEQQATLLMTYMRNSEIVREFKKRLVREFFDMRIRIMEFNHIKKTVQLPSNRTNLIDMYNPDFRETFTKAVGKQTAKSIYKKIEREKNDDQLYSFITGFSKRWFLRADVIYVQGSMDGEFKRYSTKLRATDDNIKWIDADDNAAQELSRIYNSKRKKPE